MRIKIAVDQLAKSGGPVTVAAVARQADVSRTFLYEHTEARSIVAEAALRAARGLRARRRIKPSATLWRRPGRNALNAEEVLKDINTEVFNQRECIAELLGQIAQLQGKWTDATSYASPPPTSSCGGRAGL